MILQIVWNRVFKCNNVYVYRYIESYAESFSSKYKRGQFRWSSQAFKYTCVHLKMIISTMRSFLLFPVFELNIYINKHTNQSPEWLAEWFNQHFPVQTTGPKKPYIYIYIYIFLWLRRYLIRKELTKFYRQGYWGHFNSGFNFSKNVFLLKYKLLLVD